MLLYYITDRKQFPGSESDRQHALLDRIAAAAMAGVDYIQLREKDLPAKELERLAAAALQRIRDSADASKLLINSRTDVALAVGADGVHLTSADISPSDARAIWGLSTTAPKISSLPGSWIIGVSCHSRAEVRLAESHGADFVVLAPVFEKTGTHAPALGIEVLRETTRQADSPDNRVEAGDQLGQVPVFALGGVTVANAAECVRAGASGVAGIRLFQQGNVAETIRTLRQQI